MPVSSDSDSFTPAGGGGLPTRRPKGSKESNIARTPKSDNEPLNRNRLPTIDVRRKSNRKSSRDEAKSDASRQSITIDTTERVGRPDRSLAARLRRNRNPLGSFLTSTLVHAIWILLLLFISWQSPQDQVISLFAEIESVPIDAPAEIVASIEPVVPSDALEAFESPLTSTADDTSDSPEEMAEDIVDLVEPNLMVAEVMPSAEILLPTENGDVNTQPIAIGGSLAGRSKDSRAALAAKRGGSPASEAAVERALRWIVNHQDRYDGGWRFRQKCGGCRNDGSCRSRNAATGLALMALLGAGYTHQTGPYQEAVDAGLKFLVRNQKITSEYGGSFIDSENGMYVHAIATIAVAEAYTMTRDAQLETTLAEAHRYILAAQNRKGGWRYNPGSAGDTLVTGWQVMALKSLERAKIETPQSVYDLVSVYLKTCRDSNGRYKYIPRERRATPSPTAVGILTQMYLGEPRDNPDLERGCNYLLDQGVSKTDIYFDFYSTLTLHHFQHELWDQWNTKMRDYLVKSQETGGHEDGSWHFRDKHGLVGGRLYTTAMAAMTLEVYYRYSPLFEIPDADTP